MIVRYKRIFRKISADDRSTHAHRYQYDFFSADFIFRNGLVNKFFQTADVIVGIRKGAVIIAVKIILIVFAEFGFGNFGAGNRRIETGFGFAFNFAVFVRYRRIFRNGTRVAGRYDRRVGVSVFIEDIDRKQTSDDGVNIGLSKASFSCDNRSEKAGNKLCNSLLRLSVGKSGRKIVV